jgi:hypothetical protein
VCACACVCVCVCVCACVYVCACLRLSVPSWAFLSVLALDACRDLKGLLLCLSAPGRCAVPPSALLMIVPGHAAATRAPFHSARDKHVTGVTYKRHQHRPACLACWTMAGIKSTWGSGATRVRCTEH